MKFEHIQSIVIPTKSTLASFRFYLVRRGEHILLIDAGVDTDTCMRKLLEKLQEWQLALSDIDAIILTHHHADHIGLVNRIRKVHDIPVFAHPKAFRRLRRDEDLLQERIQFFQRLYEMMGCGKEINKEIKRLRVALERNRERGIKGDLFPIQEGKDYFNFSVVDVPGHAQDHIVLFDDASGYLFSGDMVIEHISTNALIDIGEDGKRTKSLVQYEQSLKKLHSLSASVLFPGHGNVIHQSNEMIDKKLARIAQKSERVLSLITKEHTAAEIAKKIYGDRYDTLFSLVMSDIIGHLDRLVYDGKLTTKRKNGIVYFEKPSCFIQ